MDRVEEIEAAIDGLPPEEFRRISEWFLERQQKFCDEQMDSDSSSGKLDFLFEEAENESVEEILREWMPSATDSSRRRRAHPAGGNVRLQRNAGRSGHG